MRFSTSSKYCLAIAGLLLSFAAPGEAAASTLVQLDLTSLVANSEQVVRGTVDDVEAVRRDGRLFTDVQIRVTERWKGEGDPTVTVRVPGGRDGEMVTKVHGVPYFGSEEEVVLFLSNRREEASFIPTGLAQGKFVVRPSESGKLGPVAVPQVGDVRMVDRDDDRTRRDDRSDVAPGELTGASPAPVHREPLPVEELRRRVDALIDGGESR